MLIGMTKRFVEHAIETGASIDRQNDIGFAPWRVRPHFKISILSSPPTFSVRVNVVVIKLLNVFEEPFQSMYV